MERNGQIRTDAMSALDTITAVQVILASHCGDSSDEQPLSLEEIRDLRDALDNAIGSLKKLLVAIEQPSS
jgi:hypothetical protein